MRTFPISCLLALLVVLIVSGCGPARNGGSPSNIIVALEPDRDPDAMLEDRKALEAFLAETFELRVQAIVPLTSTVISEGLRNGTIDVAYLSSTAATRLMDSGVIDILLATEIEGKTSYQSYWLGRAGTPYASIQDLAGKPIAFSSRTSTSGFLIPAWDLYKQELITLESGPEGFFGRGNVHFGVGYVSAVERLLEGSVEAAAVSSYVFEQDKHLSTDQRAQLKVIDTQGPVPSHVIVVRKSLDPEMKEQLREGILEMNTGASDLRDRIFGAPLVAVDGEAHIAVTREALELMKNMEL